MDDAELTVIRAICENPLLGPIALEAMAGGLEVLDPPAADITRLGDEILNLIVYVRSGAISHPQAGQSPSDLFAALEDIAQGSESVAKGLAAIALARRAAAPDTARAAELAHFQAAVLSQIARSTTPRELNARFSDEQLADAMPFVQGLVDFHDDWAPGWATLPNKIRKLATLPDRDSLRRSRAVSAELIEIVGRLARIYTQATGRKPAVSEADAAAKPGWKGPFHRFVEAVWPALGTGSRLPSTGRLKRALARAQQVK